MQRKSYRWKTLSDQLFVSCCYLALACGLYFLGCFFYTLLSNGLSGLSVSLFTHVTDAPDQNGGLANAILGSVIMTSIAMIISIPLGMSAAIYLVEYSKKNRLSKIIRYANDILLTMPSIVIGLFVFTLLVLPFHRFSALAGSVALALIATPIIMRTTEDVLYLVSPNMREAGLALGICHYKVFFRIILKISRSGVITGIMLAFARIFGETAPLLFTSLSNDYLNLSLTQPMASLPVVIYNYALSPYTQWQSLAWAGALVMTAFVVSCNVFTKCQARKTSARVEEQHV